MSTGTDKRRISTAGALGRITGNFLGNICGSLLGMWILTLAAKQLGWALDMGSVMFGTALVALIFSCEEAKREWRDRAAADIGLEGE